MKKELQEKLLFIGGSFLALVGLVALQQNFPRGLDSSKFLAQVSTSGWDLDDCPTYENVDTIIKNGNFSDGPSDNTALNLNLSTNYRYTICGWERNFNTTYDIGVKHFDGEETPLFPFLLSDVPPAFPQISNNERYVGLIPAEHFNTFSGQSHDYLIQDISNTMEPGEEYVVSFDYYNAPNSAGIWTGPANDLSSGIAILFLNQEQKDMIDTTVFWCINNTSPFNFCGEDRDYFSSEQLRQILENNFGSSIDFVYTSPDNNLSSTNDWSSFSVNFVYPQSSPKYIAFVPIGYDPQYAYSLFWKVKTILLMDNVSIDQVQPSTCGITFQGGQELYYNNSNGEYIAYENSPINIELIGNQQPQDIDEDSFYLYSPAPGILHVKAPTDVTYTDADILELFSFQGAQVISAISFSGGNFWIEYECLTVCSETDSDFNQDGIVGDADLELLVNSFGQSCSNLESCQFDLDGDSLVTVQDLMILLGNVGQQCALPIEGSTQLENQNNSSPQYSSSHSQGTFVKPTTIPRTQSMYNYVVNTKIINPKQTALQIEQFFPQGMKLRGLYSSTKNMSLVSREGTVRFFDFRNINNITSYVLLEASPETCKIVAQNKRAYEGLVSYGICK